MTYAIFRTKHTSEDYFANWDSENYNKLTAALRTRIYNKYLIKCEVFGRDDFACANSECEFPDSPLTLHHVRFQKNGGKDSARNCVTLCDTCHRGFHRGKRRLVFSNDEKYPSTIKGHTFNMGVDTRVDWKAIKGEMKKFRKTLAHEHLYLSMDEIALLWKFLESIYSEGDD